MTSLIREKLLGGWTGTASTWRGREAERERGREGGEQGGREGNREEGEQTDADTDIQARTKHRHTLAPW
jgi:hypothetical protein